MLIDTHAHLNFSAFRDDIDEVAKRTLAEGMKVINVGSQRSTSERAIALAKQYAGSMYAAVGLHPMHLFEMEVDESEISFATRQEDFNAERYGELAAHGGVVAIGEMGIDYFHVPQAIPIDEFEHKQKLTFLRGVELAQKLRLPIILHCRGSKKDEARAYEHMLEVLDQTGCTNGVLHCYSSTWDIAKKFLDRGFMISFTGIITYPKTHELERVVKNAPMDRMMVETDAPYLAPQIVRGKRNEPRFVRYVAERIAHIKKLKYEEVEDITTANAVSFFKLS
ncbi:MAG: TatD family hydrolase [Patescibacteria group bacterium]